MGVFLFCSKMENGNREVNICMLIIFCEFFITFVQIITFLNILFSISLISNKTL